MRQKFLDWLVGWAHRRSGKRVIVIDPMATGVVFGPNGITPFLPLMADEDDPDFTEQVMMNIVMVQSMLGMLRDAERNPTLFECVLLAGIQCGLSHDAAAKIAGGLCNPSFKE